MRRTPKHIEESVDIARDYLQVSRGGADELLARDFAEVIVQIAGTCVVGLPCEKHGGAVHGQEAEELRAGVEQILRNTSDVDDDAAPDVLRAQRKALIFLLDCIDARDSLTFREVADPPTAADTTGGQTSVDVL